MAYNVYRSKKSTPPHTPSSNFYLYVLGVVRNTNSLKGICKVHGISKQKLNYYVSRLKELGILEKKGYGTWAVNEAKFSKNIKYIEVKKGTRVGNAKQVKEVKKVPKKNNKKIRGHGYVYTYPLPKIKGWSEREAWLSKKGISYKKIPQGARIKVCVGNDSFKIWLCRNSLVLYFRKDMSFWGDSAEEAYVRSFHVAKKLVSKVSSLLDVDLRVDGKYEFRVNCVRNHYAEVQNELAKQANGEKQKVQVYDKNGKLWLLIDDSLGLDEIETVNPKTARRDMDGVVLPFFNDLRDNWEKCMLPSEVTSALSGVVQAQHDITASHKYFAKNMESHVTAIQTLSLQQKRLGDLMEKLVGVINDR